MAYAPHNQPPYNPQGYAYYPPGQYPPYPPVQQFPAAQQDSGSDVEAGNAPKDELGFSDKTVRAAFVRKVFVLVTIMLLIVAGITAIPFIHPPIEKHVANNPGIVLLSLIMYVVLVFALSCCEGVRRAYPLNLVLLTMLAATLGFMTMIVTARYKTASVLMCLLITAVCCISITIFAMQTKYDMTSCFGVLILVFLFVMIFGFIGSLSSLFLHVPISHTIYSGVMAVLFMGFLAIDVQMIMGGRKLEISPEDYVFAAMQVFIDVVMIFWHLLAVFGQQN